VGFNARYMEEKNVPGHVPSAVQTGLKSEVELREMAAHKTRLGVPRLTT
jgi:hypothetical protein